MIFLSPISLDLWKELPFLLVIFERGRLVNKLNQKQKGEAITSSSPLIPSTV
jgi:hypothetical protein